MQEKHSGSKETDITSGLVIAFVVLTAVLIAKMAGDFTAVKTSTASKAAPATSCNATSNTQAWYGSNVECGKEKVSGSCPSTHVVTDNTFLIGKLRCRSYTSMDSYFSDDKNFVLTGKQSYQVRRSNAYCERMTGKAGAKCLSKSMDYDLNSDQFINPAFRSLKKSGTKCPMFVETGIMAPYTQFVTEEVCYTP